MILVSNPGTHPEMMHLAAGLINLGKDVKYASSASWAHDSIIQRIADLRGVENSLVGSNLKRRRLPNVIGRHHVKGVARGLEMLVQVAMRSTKLRTSSFIHLRNQRYQQSISKFLRKRSDIDMVVGQYTASVKVFESCAPSTVKVLNYPIVHHRWLMHEMGLEAKRNPDWSSLLQGHDFTYEQLSELDTEIDLADLILVPSTFAASTFFEYGVPQEKIAVIPLGCDLPDAPQEPTSHPEAQPLQVIFAGQATQRKGIGYLVEAVQEVENCRLSIVGSCTAEARTIIERYDKVSFIPSLPRHELYRRMQDSDLLALPSLAEGFGLVALESMANGTPCLLSAATFGPDLIEHGQNGYLLDDVSTHAIASVLRNICNDRQSLLAIGVNASAVAEKYSWRRYSDSVAELLTVRRGQSAVL